MEISGVEAMKRCFASSGAWAGGVVVEAMADGPWSIEGWLQGGLYGGFGSGGGVATLGTVGREDLAAAPTHSPWAMGGLRIRSTVWSSQRHHRSSWG